MNINYTVPEIVYVNQIIKMILILLKGREDNQMLKILECSNVWFLRFPDFKGENCIEFAVNSHCSLWETSAIERALSISLLIANSLQFTAEIKL